MIARSAVLMIATVLAGQEAFAQEAAPAKWRWFRQCAAPESTRLQVSLRGRDLLDVTLPLCHIPDMEPSLGGAPRNLRFLFTADASIFGDEFKHFGVRQIEGCVWEAGGDPDVIILGLSFVTGNQILLNTVHIAYASQSGRFDQALGLVSQTSAFRPARKSGPAFSARRRTTG